MSVTSLIQERFYVLDHTPVSNRYKISNLATNKQDLFQDDWSLKLIFFAFSQSTQYEDQIRYYVDSADNPFRHRVLTDGDCRELGGSEGWEEKLQFWAFTEKLGNQGKFGQPYTVLYTINPYRSQIVMGNRVELQGWEIHSVFWAYSKPGKYP